MCLWPKYCGLRTLGPCSHELELAKQRLRAIDDLDKGVDGT